MSKTVQLLLTENVDNVGIVGDIVKVRTGYARNYLLPRELATPPSDEMVAALQEKRRLAEAELARQREERKSIVERIEGFELTLTRPCNDLGVLYGGVTQNDIAAALVEAGFAVRPRDVRLPHAIKRIDSYDVHIKFDAEMESDIRLNVQPDRELQEDEREEMEFDDEGNLIEKPARSAASPKTEADSGPAGDTTEQPAGAPNA